MGGQLTWFPLFGVDPLVGNPEGQQRRDEIFHEYFDVAAVFGSVVNGVDEPFRQAINRYFVITRDMVEI
jgi:hypothetical protein